MWTVCLSPGCCCTSWTSVYWVELLLIAYFCCPFWIWSFSFIVLWWLLSLDCLPVCLLGSGESLMFGGDDFHLYFGAWAVSLPLPRSRLSGLIVLLSLHVNLAFQNLTRRLCIWKRTGISNILRRRSVSVGTGNGNRNCHGLTRWYQVKDHWSLILRHPVKLVIGQVWRDGCFIILPSDSRISV